MGCVRVFEADDVAAVADLFWKVRKHKTTPSPSSLRDYFRTLYLSHPACDQPAVGSLVYEDQTGHIRGFIGGIPVRLRYKNAPVWGLVAGNHMVDKEFTDPMARAMLLRKLCAGPQDLTFSDTANRISVQLWRALGARVLPVNSVRWLRVLRPGTFALNVLRRFRFGRFLSGLSFPLFSLPDRLASKLLNRSIGNAARRLEARPIDDRSIFRSFDDFVQPRQLLPDYQSQSADWRLSLAGDKQEFGPLIRTGVYENGKLLGWYLYYAKKGAIAQVLQLVANTKTVGRVLAHLFDSALRQGCAAVMGNADPAYMEEYPHHHCHCFVRGAMTVAHTRNPDIMRDLLQGNAFLSRLEGEWWTRLQGDRFG